MQSKLALVNVYCVSLTITVVELYRAVCYNCIYVLLLKLTNSRQLLVDCRLQYVSTSTFQFRNEIRV